jgi:hypothetical protein
MAQSFKKRFPWKFLLFSLASVLYYYRVAISAGSPPGVALIVVAITLIAIILGLAFAWQIVKRM